MGFKAESWPAEQRTSGTAGVCSAGVRSGDGAAKYTGNRAESGAGAIECFRSGSGQQCWAAGSSEG